MRCWLAVGVAAVAVVGLACGGGSSPHGRTPTSTAHEPTSVVTGAGLPTPVLQDTPSDFGSARDALRAKLDSIGVNIGSVPPDVRRQVLTQCRDLGRFADQKQVNDLCNAVQRAMDNGDFGLLDQVIAQLGQLKKK